MELPHWTNQLQRQQNKRTMGHADYLQACTASIAALDQAVAEATELKEAEHAACAATMATDMT